MANSGSRALAVAGVAGLLVLLAGVLRHSGGKGDTGVLVQFDRFGIPVPGTDDPPRTQLRNAAKVVAIKGQLSGKERLAQREESMMKALHDIESQVCSKRYAVLLFTEAALIKLVGHVHI